MGAPDAKVSKVREQHIAVFGESGSGKTVLLSSFFGHTQEKSFASDLWDLVADDIGLGHRLLQNYLGMRDSATAPRADHFASTTHYFSVKLKSGGTVNATKFAFDRLRLAWHDYPGEWFTESPSSDEEATRRVDTFRSLLRSDVAFLLVDGQKLLDYRGDEQRYLKSLLTNFSQVLLRLKEDLLTGTERLVEFPRIWIIALSKADLFPEEDVYWFRDLIIREAAADVQRVHETLQGFVDTPEALSVGEDFMLISSAKFERSSVAAESMKIDVSQRLGVDLILPVASLLPLERRVQWQEKMQIPLAVLDSMADNAEAMATALLAEKGLKLIKLVAKIPIVGPRANFVIPAMAAAAKIAGAQLKQLNEQARQSHNYLAATLTQFKLDLEEAEKDGLLIRAK